MRLPPVHGRVLGHRVKRITGLLYATLRADKQLGLQQPLRRQPSFLSEVAIRACTILTVTSETS